MGKKKPRTLALPQGQEKSYRGVRVGNYAKSIQEASMNNIFLKGLETALAVERLDAFR